MFFVERIGGINKEMDAVLYELTNQALSLSTDERAILAQRLWESIEGFIDPETEEAWLREAEKRWKEIEEGKVKCIPVEEAMKEARASLSRKPGYWKSRDT